MEQYITVTFNAGDDVTAIITAFLLDNGFDAVEEGEQHTVVSAKDEAFDEAAVKEIFQRFSIAYTVDTIAQQNWNAKWEESFEPVIVDDFAAVRASFHEAVPGVQHDIIITPKMSFGTGHHATTYMMIEAMRDLELAGLSVIDFGTGTAVLAILAEKMGAATVLGIDNDEWSMANAQENMESNNCRHIRLLLTDSMTRDNKVDVILANINLNVITANLDNIKLSTHTNTQILLSGFLAADEPQLTNLLMAAGFTIVRILHRNNWMAMLIKIA